MIVIFRVWVISILVCGLCVALSACIGVSTETNNYDKPDKWSYITYDSPREINGVVCRDVNWNGICDNDDRPVDDAIVALWKPRERVCRTAADHGVDEIITEMTTNRDGKFSFVDLDDGDYCVAPVSSESISFGTPTSQVGARIPYTITMKTGWFVNFGYHAK